MTIKINQPVVCPWCRRNQDAHEAYCDFRFANPNAFAQVYLGHRVLLLWQNDWLMGIFANTERGYALALIRLENIVAQSEADTVWTIHMDDGFPRGSNNKGIARLELTLQSVIL